MFNFRRVSCFWLVCFVLSGLCVIQAGKVLAHSVPGPEADQHNTVYSYSISEAALDTEKQLHVTMNVHMCPFCSPYNNYVKVNIPGIGTETTYNTPAGVTCTGNFTFDGQNPEAGDLVNIYSDVWCEWCGHWYDSRTFRVETKVTETPGLGEGACVMTLAEVGSAVNIADGNLFDSYAVSPHLKRPVSIAYNSRSARESRFGYGWNDSLDIRLIRKKDGSVILIEPDGREEVFTKNPDGTFSSPPGNHDILTADTGLLFSDDMEKGIGAWIPEYPWSQISWEWNSPVHMLDRQPFRLLCGQCAYRPDASA